MEDQPEQDALFCIEGPDEDGCVWACSPAGRDVWCQNLGPTEKVADVLSQWLGTIDYDEVEAKAPRRRFRRVEQRENRARRLADLTLKREREAFEEEDEVDRMIRQNIEDHGA